MKIINKFRFFSGIIVLFFLIGSYFIEIMVDFGVDSVTFDTLLGIIIFHNFFVFSFYILIAVLLIITGIKRIKLV